jgi:hypothetical protein
MLASMPHQRVVLVEQLAAPVQFIKTVAEMVMRFGVVRVNFDRAFNAASALA